MKLFKTYPLLLPIIFLFLIIVIIGYTVYDDNRIIVIRQEIQIKDLPPEFDGFSILQVSDLHGKWFGDSQQRLTETINSLDYDGIAFTGDMQDIRTKDILPFLELIRGIKKKTSMFYISGNTGPFDILYLNSTNERNGIDLSYGEITNDGKLLESEGCTLLDKPQEIERGRARIWFATDFSPLLSMETEELAKQELLKAKSEVSKNNINRHIEYQENMQKIYASFKDSDTLIGIFHYPLTSQMLENPQGLPPYDLILAGHYHGGQIRVPLLGAVYIPDNTLPNHGFFPPQDLVSGLFTGNKIQQYVSRGLGASSRYLILQFRLFNTPEINLITLRGSEH